ncbi:MAG: sugar ABC transporter permease [Lentisphaeria bacterium]|jgi:multiple sugar transport system permease protein|nr:sugar ABC transporter permease [Lentisphaeria bacterium]
MPLSRHQTRKLATGLAFIGPNVVGFLIFTLFPLVFSLAMAFTNWDLRLHNAFTDESVRFVGFANFARLFREPDFLKFLGNTLFLMMGLPFAVAGSLGAALLLSQDLKGKTPRIQSTVATAILLTIACLTLVVVGLGSSAVVILVTGVACLVLTLGVGFRQSAYRTLFYFPHFTAGVATFLLWKRLYAPLNGPINNALRPPLSIVTDLARNFHPDFWVGVALVCSLLAALLPLVAARRLSRLWRDGEAGWLALGLGTIAILIPAILWPFWTKVTGSTACIVVGFALALVLLARQLRGREFTCAFDRGLGPVLITSVGVMILEFALLGLGNALCLLPVAAAAPEGIPAPEWLTQFHWAKPSLMFMGFWAAIGSNNMLLYLAGLSNIPPELYEAADIDGASRSQRFWHVTWPQLAPVTFFILVMGVIGGLQGGFEMARTMTQGGPAKSTTTLSYYVYIEGFETGHLGYASAIAWTLFALVFIVTLFNWKFGNRYTND